MRTVLIPIRAVCSIAFFRVAAARGSAPSWHRAIGERRTDRLRLPQPLQRATKAWGRRSRNMKVAEKDLCRCVHAEPGRHAHRVGGEMTNAARRVEHSAALAADPMPGRQPDLSNRQRAVQRTQDAARGGPGIVQLHAGEVLAIAGESGSGKTTLSRMMPGLLRPTSGGIWFDGKPIVGQERRGWRGGCRPFFRTLCVAQSAKTLADIIALPLVVHRIGAFPAGGGYMICYLVGLSRRLVHNYPVSFPAVNDSVSRLPAP